MSTSRRLTPVQWAVCIVAAIGFAFDIYELLVLPLIAQPAITELGGVRPDSPEFTSFALAWRGRLFYIPAMAGGLFGLLGGYLTDRYGRRRVLVWSILLYAFAALAAGYSTSLEQLLFFRCLVFIGVCVEFVAAVAWLAELFPEPRQREAVIGYTQAFSSIGGLMVTGAYALAVRYADSFPAIYGGHDAWRYTVMSGVIPAIPLIVIRPFLPESPRWRERKDAGTLKRPSIGELFAPEFRRTTIVTTIMFAASYAAAFGAIQQLPGIVPGLPDMAAITRAAQPAPPPIPAQQSAPGTPAPAKPKPTPQQREAQRQVQQSISLVQTFQEVGGLLGRLVLAFLAIRIVSRVKLLRIFQIPGLIVMPFVFAYAATQSVDMLKWGAAIAGFVTVAQFSFWGNYLPLVYPLHLRGTGESFAANIGGRMIGTAAALVTTSLAESFTGTGPARLAMAAAFVGTAVYVIGIIASFWLPDPGQKAVAEKD